MKMDRCVCSCIFGNTCVYEVWLVWNLHQSTCNAGNGSSDLLFANTIGTSNHTNIRMIYESYIFGKKNS